MNLKWTLILILNFLLFSGWSIEARAIEHTQKDGLFSMDIPNEWHWVEDPDQIVIAYPDGKTLAMDIEMVPSNKLSDKEIKQKLNESNTKMIKEGVEAHHGTFIDLKAIKLGGVYATQLDFKTAGPDSIQVAYVAFFNKGYAFSITYGTADEKIRSVLEDTLATIKFK